MARIEAGTMIDHKEIFHVSSANNHESLNIYYLTKAVLVGYIIHIILFHMKYQGVSQNIPLEIIFSRNRTTFQANWASRRRISNLSRRQETTLLEYSF